jgi:hypothetical protein
MVLFFFQNSSLTIGCVHCIPRNGHHSCEPDNVCSVQQSNSTHNDCGALKIRSKDIEIPTSQPCLMRGKERETASVIFCQLKIFDPLVGSAGMLVEGEFNPKYLHNSVSLDKFLIQLQSPFFQSIAPFLYRCHFSRWALQTTLLKKVCNFLHLIDIPNLSKDSILSTLKYLGNDKLPIPEVWIWIGEHERILIEHQQLLNELQTKEDLMFPVSSLTYIWILTPQYENIAHEAIHFNQLHFLSSLCYLPNASQINQRNIDLNSPCHLAILQEKFEFVTVLINSPNIDLTVCDRNLRTPLHLLLFLSLQKIRMKIILFEKKVSTLILQILSRDPSLFFLVDCQGLHSLDYALMIGKIPILSSLFSHHLLPSILDYSPYLYQSLRFNQPPLVNYFVQLYLSCDTVVQLLNTSDLSGQILSDLLCYCIEKNHLKSLLVLLSKKQFVCAINSFTSSSFSLSSSSSFNNRVDRHLPLHCAINAMKFNGRIEPFRILDKFGVHINVPVQEQREFQTSPSRPPASHSLMSTFQAWLIQYDHSHYSSHDNIFSYLCAIQSSQSVHQTPSYSSSSSPTNHYSDLSLTDPQEMYFHHLDSIERNAIALLREVFVKNYSLKCYLTNTSRKYQAAERWERATEPTPSSSSDRVLFYFWNSFSFQCNPLVTTILSSQSHTTRSPPWRVYQLHSSHLHQYERVRFLGYPLLDYLLTHTPFSELINAQEARSRLTPLAAACLSGNKTLIELLCRHGANRNMKLNAYHLSMFFPSSLCLSL